MPPAADAPRAHTESRSRMWTSPRHPVRGKEIAHHDPEQDAKRYYDGQEAPQDPRPRVDSPCPAARTTLVAPRQAPTTVQAPSRRKGEAQRQNKDHCDGDDERQHQDVDPRMAMRSTCRCRAMAPSVAEPMTARYRRRERSRAVVARRAPDPGGLLPAGRSCPETALSRLFRRVR